MNRIDLNDRRAVVTGGAQGIGRAIAERLSASGAAVCLWDRDSQLVHATRDELSDAAKVHAVVVDVTDPAAVDDAVEQTLEALGGLEILVNNAGIAGPSARLWEYTTADWHSIMDVDLTGVFYCCRAVVPHMMRQDYGRILNVASIAGKEGVPNAAPYSAAKAGIIALTKSLAKELADHDIAVNCVTPGAVKTRIFEQISQEHIAYALASIPRGRFLKAEEAAAMIAWLVSAENSFTTGAVFDLSGGRATY